MTAPTIPPYNPNIPLRNQNIAESQGNFLYNFMDLFDAFGKDHVALNAALNAGNHNVVELVEQLVGLSTQSQEVAFYSKKVEGQTDQLFMRYPLNGTEIPLSQYQVYPLPQVFLNNVLIQTPYFTFLPGGILVYFGLVIPTSNNFPIDLSPHLARNIIGIQLCPVGAAAGSNYQSNMTLTLSNGIYTSIILNSSPALPLTQYYMVFGNL